MFAPNRAEVQESWLGSGPGWPADCTCPPSPASSVTVTAGQPAQVKVPGERIREVTLDPGASASPNHQAVATRRRKRHPDSPTLPSGFWQLSGEAPTCLVVLPRKERWLPSAITRDDGSRAPGTVHDLKAARHPGITTGQAVLLDRRGRGTVCQRGAVPAVRGGRAERELLHGRHHQCEDAAVDGRPGPGRPASEDGDELAGGWADRRLHRRPWLRSGMWGQLRAAGPGNERD